GARRVGDHPEGERDAGVEEPRDEDQAERGECAMRAGHETSNSKTSFSNSPILTNPSASRKAISDRGGLNPEVGPRGAPPSLRDRPARDTSDAADGPPRGPRWAARS